MPETLPVVLVPGMLTSPRLYTEQLPALWRLGPVMVADNTRGETFGQIATAILAAAPPRFALAGLSMGGGLALAIMRQAAGRVAKLALLDTTARPDTPEQTARRQVLIRKSRAGRFAEVPGDLWPVLVAPARLGDSRVREIVQLMAEETGPEAFIREQGALISRPDSRPGLSSICCPTLVLVGEHDAITPPEVSAEIAAAIPGARLVVIPGSGHLSTIEQPGMVTQALVHWLGSG